MHVVAEGLILSTVFVFMGAMSEGRHHLIVPELLLQLTECWLVLGAIFTWGLIMVKFVLSISEKLVVLWNEQKGVAAENNQPNANEDEDHCPLPWADEEDEDASFNEKERIILPSAPRAAHGPAYDDSDIPREPPFTAHLGNLPYDIDEEEIYEFFKDLDLAELKLPRDQQTNRLRGFGYADFESRAGLIEALTRNEQMMRGRPDFRRSPPHQSNNNTSSIGSASEERYRDSNSEPEDDRDMTRSGGGGGHDKPPPQLLQCDECQSDCLSSQIRDYRNVWE